VRDLAGDLRAVLAVCIGLQLLAAMLGISSSALVPKHRAVGLRQCLHTGFPQIKDPRKVHIIHFSGEGTLAALWYVECVECLAKDLVFEGPPQSDDFAN
jgi:hypothetical protein